MKKTESRRRHQEMLRAVEKRIRERKGKLSSEQESRLEKALSGESELDLGSFFDSYMAVYRQRVQEYRLELGVEDRHEAMILALLELDALQLWLISRDVMDLREDLQRQIDQIAQEAGREGSCGKQ